MTEPVAAAPLRGMIMGSFQRTVEFRLLPATLKNFLSDMSQFSNWLPESCYGFEPITKTQVGKGARTLFNLKHIGLDLPSEIEITICDSERIQWSVAAPPLEIFIRFNLSESNGKTSVGVSGEWNLARLAPWRVRTQAKARMHMDKDGEQLVQSVADALSREGAKLKDPEVKRVSAVSELSLTEDGFQPVCELSDISEGDSKVVTALGKEIALFNIDGALHAIDNLCPHRQAPLGHGQRDGAVVTCPLHRWSFDVTNGKGVSHPKASVRCFSVRVLEQQIQIGPAIKAAESSPS